MTEPSCAPLHPDWAFVVQLFEHTSFLPAGLHGRIEHVSSGRASEFGSLEQARAFMERVMSDGGVS